MNHGARHYFQESRHSRRRLAATTLALHLLALALLLATRIPALRELFEAAERPIVRIGYEGPDRILERVVLASQSGRREPLVDVGEVRARPTRRGGSGLEPSVSHDAPSTSKPSMFPGTGEDELTLIAKARMRNASAPMIQSSELVIEAMEEPRYPEKLHAQGIEGRVALMALIDTTGRVADLTVVGGSGFAEFEASASEAVRNARFRPYRTGGAAQEVYALIRYRFRIY